jgi:hypothetical protein
MSNALRTAACMGFGAGLMYLFDPAAGRRRRAFIRDKTGHYVHKAACVSDIVSRDIANRLEGFKHEGFNRSSLQKLDVLQERWSPATRFLISVGALALSFYGTKRRGLTGQMLSLAAGGLMVEALTNVALFQHRKTRRNAGQSMTQQTVSAHGHKAQVGQAEPSLERGGESERREETGIGPVPAGQPATAGTPSPSADVVQGATSGQATVSGG